MFLPSKTSYLMRFFFSSFTYFLILTNLCFTFFHCLITTSTTPFMYGLSFGLWTLLLSLKTTNIILFRKQFLGASSPSTTCICFFQSFLHYFCIEPVTSSSPPPPPIPSIIYHLFLNNASSSWGGYLQVVGEVFWDTGLGEGSSSSCQGTHSADPHSPIQLITTARLLFLTLLRPLLIPSFTNPRTSSPLFPPGDSFLPLRLCHLLWRPVLCWLVYRLWLGAYWLSVTARGSLAFSANVHPSSYTMVWDSRCLLALLTMDLMFPVSNLLVFWEKKIGAAVPFPPPYKEHIPTTIHLGASTNIHTVPIVGHN